MEYIPETRRLRALGFWLDGSFLEDYEFYIEGTPCQPVIETKSRAHFPERLLELFPHDAELAALGAVSYMGSPLLDADGTFLGAPGVLDNRPMHAEPQLYELFDLFAVRAVAEIRRLRAETAMREREAQLSLLLDTAMDAILVLDGEFRITRLNPRATELFACTEEDLAGESFLDFLGPAAAAKFSRLVKELQAARVSVLFGCWKGWRQFVGTRHLLPAEAAVSRYLYNGEPYYTVFLRSTSERLEAERRIRVLMEEAESLRAVVGEAPGEMGIIGRSAAIRGVCNSIRQVAATDAIVLILGETGTGKELVARAIHDAGARRGGSVGAGKLRGDTGVFDRERIFRAREGGLHGGHGAAGGALCAGGWWHVVPGRDRRTPARFAGQAASRAAGRRVRAIGRNENTEGGRACDRRDQPQSGGGNLRLSAAEVEQFEKGNLLRALETCGWKISGAKGVSALLGLPPSTVSSRIKALGIQRL